MLEIPHISSADVGPELTPPWGPRTQCSPQAPRPHTRSLRPCLPFLDELSFTSFTGSHHLSLKARDLSPTHPHLCPAQNSSGTQAVLRVLPPGCGGHMA